MHAPVAKPALDRTGFVQGAAAYLIWGLLPLFFLLLEGVGAVEIVASRIVWSLVLLVAIVVLVRRWAAVRAAFGDRRVMLLLACSAALISVNWLVYVWAVQHGQVLAASLGYFLNPLVNVLLGVVVLRERLTRMQSAAVALAAAGVLVLAAGAGGGLWISLTLALSFGVYGLVRKVVDVAALEGLAIETALLTPIALGYLAWLASVGTLAFGSAPGITALLIVSGALTALPLLLFAAAARRLPYSALGVLQYLAPTLQFLIAILWLGEALTTAHIVCFALIWAGLALYVGSGFWPRGRAARA